MLKIETKEIPMQYFDRISCVYFIYVNGEVVYIGQSVNLYSRIAVHKGGVMADMDRVEYIPMPENELYVAEKSLIRYFAPKRNGIDNLGFLLTADEVKEEIDVINKYVDSPEFKASKHISQLCHSMYLKYGYKEYKRVYDMYINDYTLCQSKKVIEMKRTLR